jgi:hypothetical protein
MVKMHAITNEHDHQKMTEEIDTVAKGGDPRNYENYGSHNQVAAGYKDNNCQGDDRRNSGYRSYGRKDYGSSKRFQSSKPREYNPSPDDMLNEPCHIHSAFIDGKRVSRHAMKDCKTFLKLQEAVVSKQAEAKR